jgi:hypothetical protein
MNKIHGKLSVQKQYYCWSHFSSKQITPLVRILIEMINYKKLAITASEKTSKRPCTSRTNMKKPAHGRSHAPAWAGGPQTNDWAAKLAQLSLPHGPKLAQGTAERREPSISATDDPTATRTNRRCKRSPDRPPWKT